MRMHSALGSESSMCTCLWCIYSIWLIMITCALSQASWMPVRTHALCTCVLKQYVHLPRVRLQYMAHHYYMCAFPAILDAHCLYVTPLLNMTHHGHMCTFTGILDTHARTCTLCFCRHPGSLCTHMHSALVSESSM